MKRSLLAKSSLMLSSLVSTSVFAHTGHLANESVHGWLHVEHIVAIVTIGLVIYTIKALHK